MKKKVYSTPESIVVEIETSSIMDAFTGSKTFDPSKPEIYDGTTPIDPNAASRRGSDWDEYFNR